ncbi:MAG: hypothetical protein ACI4J0_09195 [Huintestinicola sp.]|uniref:hypothetical protein n=1 Tax=Huintestinicola sp. TaxID=2981661 RepID=UPI003F10A596
MSLKRYHTLYPYSIFRAQIVFKNVAPPDDKWAEGVLCRDPEGAFSIINRKAGEGVYALDPVFIDTLGMASGFMDGSKRDIFEGDIIRICRFSGGLTENVKPAEIVSDEQEDELPERTVYADIPEEAEELSRIEGVVFMNGGTFCVQFYDEASKTLNAMPLYMFFGFDMLPAEGAAVKVIGNMYDDEELFAKTLRLSDNAQN